MSVNRQQLLNLQNRICNRPKRLNSVYVAPTLEDIGILAEINENRNSQLPNVQLKQQSAIRTQLKKYKNLYLYDKKLFKNRKENHEFKENKENKLSSHQIDTSKQSKQTQWQDDIKITKLSLMKSEVLKRRESEAIKSQNTTSFLPSRKISNINPDPIQFKNIIVLPSIRGWENNNLNTQRSN